MRSQTTHRQRFARSVEPPALSPTMADIEARVYSLTYLTGCAKHSLLVLAADPEQAAQLGAIRLRSQGDLNPPAPLEIDELGWAGVETKANIVSFEHPEERQLRQDAFKGGGEGVQR